MSAHDEFDREEQAHKRLLSKVDITKSDIQALDRGIRSKSGELSTIQRQLSTKEKQIKNLEDEKKRLEQQLSQFESESEDYKRKLLDLKRRIDQNLDNDT